MKLTLTGAQGSGKSTIIEIAKKSNDNIVKIYSSILRGMNAPNHSENGDEALQNLVMSIHEKNVNEVHPQGIVIYDRCALDTLVFSDWLNKSGKVSDSHLENMVDAVKRNITKYDVVAYCKAEFAMVNDGFRNTNKTFQLEIDELFKKWLDKLEIKHVALEGLPAERYQTLVDYSIKNNYKLTNKNIDWNSILLK